MFADRAKIYIRSGKGGDGHVSFRRELFVPSGGPDGGDGGRGGDVIFEVDKGLNALSDYRHKRKYAAGDGEPGGKRRCHGADGKDIILKVPEGTVITVVAFPDGRTVEYEPEQMEMIEHANAITIHKAQGSECEVVIIPWLFAFRVMLKRNILYTGITRAKKTVYLVGDWRAVCQAVHNDDSGRRNTILGERIVRFYQQYLREQEPEQLKLAV